MDGKGFAWLGDTNYWSDANGGPHDNRPVGEVAKILSMDVNFPVQFARGGQFVVTRDAIRARPKTFYALALLTCNNVDGAPWCFERLWSVIFNG
jgi:hypothetical protein